ncbi:MAG: enoyl-CoA hydratase [Rhodospirillaceae bacterium]|nr:enoyl-CoA hydratase [Rhodospirillaceae bacterium]|tara:strand:- start:796 stop:1572 length:777 start_codon:yes stop_codon:yes gene_type:complete
MTARTVKSEMRGGVLILTLNAPEKKNAISTEMRTDLRDQLTQAMANADVRAIVLTGAAGTFCAGADVSQMVVKDISSARKRLRILHDVVRLLRTGEKPTIAAVEGHAVGAGLSLALACDFVVASETAKLGAVFAKMGLIGDCGLLWTLPQRIGQAKARDMLFSAGIQNGSEALADGLIDALVSPGEALDVAVNKAGDYAAVAPLAISATKSVLNKGASSIEDILAIEEDVGAKLAESADHAEAKQAFLEKRKPVFSGK